MARRWHHSVGISLGGIPLGVMAVVAGCSLTTSFDGLQGGTNPGLNLAGSLPEDASPLSPSGNDASSSPTNSPEDAGMDGAMDATVPAVPDAEVCPKDLTADPRHCGACGHDCLGGACVGGRCAPIALASDQGEVRGLHVRENHLVWASQGTRSIVFCSKGDCSNRKNLASDVAPADVASYEGGVVWLAKDGSVTAAGWDGAQRRVLVPARDGGSVGGRIAVAAGVAFFTTVGADSNTLWKVPLAGGPVESVGGGGITAFGVAVSAGRVFWTAEADGGVILSANLQGGEVRTVAEGQRFPVSLSWQNDALVWANYVADGGVQRARELPDGGWRWETLVKDQPTPWFAVDRPEALFWTVTQAPGAVYMCPSGGCNGPPQTLVGGLVRPTFLAVDEKAVYVASQDGRVLKVAR